MRRPRLTRVSEGKPLLRLLITSKVSLVMVRVFFRHGNASILLKQFGSEK